MNSVFGSMIGEADAINECLRQDSNLQEGTNKY